ncbi:MAG: hypothetical protein QGG14_10545 [Planctomycetota bacterium]|jgi:uncharacterized coiled-coil protein SlyX|nr:hypothetical protein [Planctomycetota bacterium]
MSCQSLEDRSTKQPRTLESLEAVFAPTNQQLAVVANQLEVDVSRELWDRFAHPAASGLHEMSLQEGPPRTYVFVNKLSAKSWKQRGESNFNDLSLPLKFTIGKQSWFVVERAVFRLHGKGVARFDAVATGDIIVSRPKRPAKRVVELRVGSGTWHELP